MWAGLPSGASKSIPDGERPTATAGAPGPGRRAWDAADPSAEEGAESLAYEDVDDDEEEDHQGQQQIEMGDKVDAQADAGKKEASEKEGDELIDGGPDPLAEVGRMADGDAGEKSTEDGLYSEPLGEGDGCPSLAPDGGERFQDRPPAKVKGAPRFRIIAVEPHFFQQDVRHAQGGGSS
jgi:hypothetical protein